MIDLQTLKFRFAKIIANHRSICYNAYEIGEETHNKKRNFNSSIKGMTPIEKNIRVIDEQGNEYEATYSQRAKGHIKNGRARFVDENTICLACPPKNMEVNMSISLKEIWNRIVATQNKLESIDNILFKIQCIEESGKYVDIEDSEHYGEPLEYCSKVALEKIQTVKEIACTREHTLKQLLDFYIREFEECKSNSIDNCNEN